jgi:hypothetical protein
LLVNAVHVDKVIQFALLAAGRSDDWDDRELGPIHLLKYVYLADLAYAERNSGATFTGADWQFFHFGPWSPEVHARIAPAVSALGARETRIESRFSDDDVVRWSLVDEEAFERIERALPLAVALNVKRAVHRFGHDTTALLHYVYATQPMLRAAPREILDFTNLETYSVPPQPNMLEVREPTSKQKKKYEAQAREVKQRIAATLAAKREKRAAQTAARPPRYDAVFSEGVAWLDSLAGPQGGDVEGEATFAEDVWTSAARGERRDG